MLKKKAILKEDTNTLNSVDERLNLSEVFGVEHHGRWVYAFLFGLILLGILMTAVGVVSQVQSYREENQRLLKLQETFRQLQVDNQSMLLEQQTVSATPQIMGRSMNELGMFYPEFTNRMIIEVNPNVVTHQAVASQPESTAMLASGAQP